MMMPATLTRSGPPLAAPHARRGGFTLFELLVAIGIMVILAGIALPALMSARKSAKRSALTNQLQLIYTGLEAYKSDFGGRFPAADLNFATPPYAIGDNGAFTLCRALFAPALENTPSATGVIRDGNEGPGFRMKRDDAGNPIGKVWGPYLNPDSFRFGYSVSDGAGGFVLSQTGGNLLPTDYARLVVADASGKPILYCPPVTARPRFANSNVFLADSKKAHTDPKDIIYFDLDQLTGHPDVATSAMDDYRGLLSQTGETGYTNFVTRAQKLLGARPEIGNGRLDGTQETFTFPVLLWAAGPDGQFGPVGGKNFDDVILGEQLK